MATINPKNNTKEIIKLKIVYCFNFKIKKFIKYAKQEQINNENNGKKKKT